MVNEIQELDQEQVLLQLVMTTALAVSVAATWQTQAWELQASVAATPVLQV